MLRISKNATLTDIVTEDGSNPISTQHPIEGSVEDLQLWMFNDEPTNRFENISIDPTDTTDTDESTWVQLAPDNAGAPGAFLPAGEALTMANVSDSNVGKAFWMRVTAPSVPDVQNKTDIALSINFRRFAV